MALFSNRKSSLSGDVDKAEDVSPEHLVLQYYLLDVLGALPAGLSDRAADMARRVYHRQRASSQGAEMPEPEATGLAAVDWHALVRQGQGLPADHEKQLRAKWEQVQATLRQRGVTVQPLDFVRMVLEDAGAGAAPTSATAPAPKRAT